MNNENNSIIYCTRCGSEINSNARYCMKCGNLNPEHPDNKDMLKYINNHQESYVVGNGGTLFNKDNQASSISVSSNTGNFKTCFLINIILYLFLILGFSILTFLSVGSDITSFIDSNIGLLYIFFSIIFLYMFAGELLFMKLNQKWWIALIPIYNFFVLSKSIFGNILWGLLIFIPGVNLIYYFVLLYRLAKSFNKSRILMILFPMIMILIISYGTSSFNNINYVNEIDSLETEFKMKKRFLIICLVFLIGGIIMYFYTHYNEISNKIRAIYLYNISSIVYKNTKKKYEVHDYSCTNDNDLIKYFYYKEVDEYFFIPFGILNPSVEAYVKVVPNGEDVQYFISLTNGEKGISETLYEYIKLDSFTEYKELNSFYNSNVCSIN